MRSIKDIFREHAVFNSEGKHINGTDKQSNHNYGDAYEGIIEDVFSFNFDDHDRIISPRDSIKLMMEIGVADGSCLQAWKEVFPNATIVGMDIHHSDKARGDRIEFYLGNQCSKASCENAAGGRLFDIIIEDATHQLDATLLTLLFMWPFVKPGGIYVIEEFSDVGSLRNNITSLWMNAEIIDTAGPYGGIEPLVVLRKSKWTK